MSTTTRDLTVVYYSGDFCATGEWVALRDGSKVFAGEACHSRHYLLFFVRVQDEIERAFSGAIVRYKSEVREAGVDAERTDSVNARRLSTATLTELSECLAGFPDETYASIAILDAPSCESFIEQARQSDASAAGLMMHSWRSWTTPETLRLMYGDYDEVGPSDNGRTVHRYGPSDERIDINLFGLWIENFEYYFQWVKLADAKVFPLIGDLLLTAEETRFGAAKQLRPAIVGRSEIATLHSYYAELTTVEGEELRSAFLYPAWDSEGKVTWSAEDEQEESMSKDAFVDMMGPETCFDNQPTAVTLVGLIEDGYVDVRGRPIDALAEPRDYTDDSDVFYSGVSLRDDDKSLMVGNSVLWNVEIRFNSHLLPGDMYLPESRFPSPMTDGDISGLMAKLGNTADEGLPTDRANGTLSKGRQEKYLPPATLEAFVDQHFQENGEWPKEAKIHEYFKGRYDRDARRKAYRLLAPSKKWKRGNPRPKATNTKPKSTAVH